MSKIKKKLRRRLAKRVLAGKITVGEALDAMAAAYAPRRPRQPGGAAKSVPVPGSAPAAAVAKSAGPGQVKGYKPLAAQVWSASELAALAPFAGNPDPAMRALADAKMAERRVM